LLDSLPFEPSEAGESRQTLKVLASLGTFVIFVFYSIPM